MKKAALTLLSLLFLWHAPALLAADSSWLVGKWELAYDPDDGDKDWVEFTADGKAVSISSTGRQVPGQYVLTEDEVDATFRYNGQTIPMTFTYGPDRQKLLLYSEHTRHTAEYKKMK